MTLKDKARAYFGAVNNYDVATIERMVEENYIQHNPFVPTGRAAFLALIPKLKSFGSKIRNVRIFEDGSHVIMHHRWESAAPFGAEQMAAFHIIRFDGQGLVAEHWSIMRPDTPGASLTDGTTEIRDLPRTQTNKAQITRLFEALTETPPADISGFFRIQATDFLRPELRYRKQHKVFGEGNFTLSISEATWQSTPTAIYDLFRLEGGQIAEHWRISQEIPQTGLANHNTMFGF